MGGRPKQAGANGTIRDAVEVWVRGIPTKRRGLALIATSLLLVALGTIGVLYDGNLVWINRLEHPFIFGCFAAAAFGFGACQFFSQTWFKALIVVATVVVGGAWFVIGFLWVSLFGMSLLPVASADAPGGREYKAVVYEQPDWIDRVWYVYIRQTRGLLSREWRAGCISNDAIGGSFIEQVIWQSPNHLLVSTGGAGIDIFVDPRTGKPQPRMRWMAHVDC